MQRFSIRFVVFLFSTASLIGISVSATEQQKSAAPAKSAAPPKAKAGQKTTQLTTPEFEDRWVACFRRLLLDGYRTHGKRDPAWDAEAEVFLDEWATVLATAPWSASDRTLYCLANAAVKAGCNDPLVVAGHSLQKARLQIPNANDYLELSQQIREAGYSSFLSAYFAGCAPSKYELADDEQYQQAVKALIAETHRLIAAEIAPGDERPLYNKLVGLFHTKRKWADADNLMKQLVDDAASPEQKWLARMLVARYCREQGWIARGTGYANTVTPEGWQIFHEKIGQMVEHLQAAYQLIPEHPEAAVEMMAAAANGQGGKNGETVETWFRRAVAAQCDYDRAYSSMFQFSAPRWGGSHDIMEKAGRVGLDTGRFDTTAPFQYFYAINAIARDLGTEQTTFWDNDFPRYYPQLQRMFAGYEATERLKDRLPFFRSLHAILAVRNKKYEEALAELRKINDEIQPEAMQYSPMTRQGLINTIHALGGPAGKQVADAQRLLTEANLDEAEKLVNEAAKIYADKNDKPASMMLAHMSAGIGIQRKLQTHDWVDLTFDDSFTGWTRVQGDWKRRDDRTVVGTGSRQGLLMSLATSIGHRFQYRGEIEIPKTKYNTDNAGVILCVTGKPVQRILKFLVFPQSTEPKYYLGFGNGQADQTPGDIRLDRNHFDITVWDRSLQVKLNGEVLKRTPWLDDDEPFGEEERIGLTGYYYYDGPPITFRNLQVRKLLNPPDDF